MAKFAAKGVVVKTGASATPTQDLAGVLSVSLDTGALGMIDATTHDSIGTREYIPEGLLDTLSAEIELTWDPTNTYHDALVDAKIARTKWYFTFVMSDSGGASFAAGGYITNITVPALDPKSGLLTCSVSYKADGASTFTQ